MRTPDRTTLARVAAPLLTLALGACAGRGSLTPAPRALPASVAPHVDRAATRIADLLVGRVAGVQIAEYGDDIAVRVRGASSLTGGEPLVVLDGYPIPGGGRALAALNPADVLRIDVLKDVASTAVYGSRGANGVLVVTTRRALARAALAPAAW